MFAFCIRHIVSTNQTKNVFIIIYFVQALNNLKKLKSKVTAMLPPPQLVLFLLALSCSRVGKPSQNSCKRSPNFQAS